jgi:hypothetical protein
MTEAGLKELALLKGLTALFLNSSKVANAGLKELSRFKGLTTLHLGGTKVTDEGEEELQKVLPRCEIGASRSRRRMWASSKRPWYSQRLASSMVCRKSRVDIGEAPVWVLHDLF